jgi:imidazolonepropionase-like amidohydrolase
MTLVPTLRIYRLVQRMIDAGSLPAALLTRVDEAVGAHPRAVLRARDAGLRVALGTDYGTPQQHGANAREFDALVGAGLTPGEALLAATRAGAELLARVAPQDPAAVRDRAAAPDPAALAGRIAEGAVADGVILRRDPSQPGALSDPESIAAVLLGGRAIDPTALRAG